MLKSFPKDSSVCTHTYTTLALSETCPPHYAFCYLEQYLVLVDIV